eukprot:20572-Heterococcus_DN1.PRE.2
MHSTGAARVCSSSHIAHSVLGVDRQCLLLPILTATVSTSSYHQAADDHIQSTDYKPFLREALHKY